MQNSERKTSHLEVREVKLITLGAELLLITFSRSSFYVISLSQNCH